jgi:hypothetical protein
VQNKCLLRLEEQDCAVTQVKVDEVLSLCGFVSGVPITWAHSWWHIFHTVGDEAAKVSANDTVPCCTLPLVKLSRVSVNGERGAVLRRTVRLMW